MGDIERNETCVNAADHDVGELCGSGKAANGNEKECKSAVSHLGSSCYFCEHLLCLRDITMRWVVAARGVGSITGTEGMEGSQRKDQMKLWMN